VKRHAGPARLYLSRAALTRANLPRHLRTGISGVNDRALDEPVVVACASEILAGGRERFAWDARPDMRYLVLADVPEPALVRLPRLLGLHRPDYRLHVSRDFGTVRRLLIGLRRTQPVLGIVDAYLLLDRDLYVLTADFELRCFPIRKVSLLAALSAADRVRFTVDEDGSYLYWPAHDLHLGVSQLLQEVDPAFMVDVAIERNEHDKTGAALRAMREQRGLRQSDIPGISVRQVSRVEKGTSRLRYGAAQRFAAAFGLETSVFLDELARVAAAIHDAAESSWPPRQRRTMADTEPADSAA
jgi:transcriptional regulator with XRE-family HTH domain